MAGINANTKFISHFNGQNGGKEIIDNGNTGHIVTQIATAQLSTTQKQFGSTSLQLDGNSDFLTIPDSPDWDIYANTIDDWTIDYWFKHNNNITAEIVLSVHEDDSNRWRIFHQGGIFWDARDATINNISLGFSQTLDTNWHHVAFIKVGNQYAIYFDGIQRAYQQSNGVDTYAGLLVIGKEEGIAPFHFNGNLDEIRIQKSNIFSASPNVGLTDTITIPTDEHISNINTKLLLHMNSHDISGDGGSNNYHIPSFIGTAQLDTAIKQFGSASVSFDGNSDYITIPDSDDFDVTTDWTLDFWFKFNDLTGLQYIFNHLQSPGEQMALVHDNVNLTFNWDETFGVGSEVVSLFGPAITDTDWHHIAIIRENGQDWGMYIDGTQVAYQNTTNFTTQSGLFYIGQRGNGASFFNGNTDEFRIQRENDFSALPNVGLTDTITVPTTEYSSPPQAPTGLNAVTISTSEIDLSWSVPVNDGGSPITGYKIERESPIAGGFATIVADTGNTNVTFSDSLLSEFTQYNYRVSAINANGTGNPSNEANTTTQDAPNIPSIPDQNLTEGVFFQLQLTATDNDSIPAQLIWTNIIAFPLPTGSNLTTAGLFTWTPDFTQAPGSPYTIGFRVTDQDNNIDEVLVFFNVAEGVPADDEIRFNKFLGTHENIIDISKDLNLDKFTGRHYKNYDKL